MAKMRNSKLRKIGTGYKRFVGNDELAVVLAKVQSTIISNGTELEKMITAKTSNVIKNLDDFVVRCNRGEVKEGSYLCPKNIVKMSEYKLEEHEPDFLVFEITSNDKKCYVVELKDGDNFDTKKSGAEKKMLEKYVQEKGSKLPFTVDYYICSFNQSDKQEIVEGFKHAFSIDKVMTGRELCEILGIDFDEIVTIRNEDAEDNFQFLMESLLEVSAVKEYVFKKYKDELGG